jgi:hypothetical protein
MRRYEDFAPSLKKYRLTVSILPCLSAQSSLVHGLRSGLYGAGIGLLRICLSLWAASDFARTAALLAAAVAALVAAMADLAVMRGGLGGMALVFAESWALDDLRAAVAFRDRLG